MIRFTIVFSRDSALNNKIRLGIIQTILSYMDTMLEKSNSKYGTGIPDGTARRSYMMSSGEFGFVQAYRQMFPAWYPVRRMYPTFIALYDLLKDTSAERTPDLE